MAQQIMKAQNSIVLVSKQQSVRLAWRRLLAWSLEVSLVAMGFMAPWAAGQYVLMAEVTDVIAIEEIEDPLRIVLPRALLKLTGERSILWCTMLKMPGRRLLKFPPIDCTTLFQS